MGLVGATLTFVGAAAFASLTLPWTGTGDSIFHLDYLYQLEAGQLPAPRGLEFKYPEDAAPSSGRQYASAHPPLFYLLVLALIPPLDGLGWESVVGAGRAVNTVAGAVCVLLLGLAGWELGGRHRARLAIGAAATGALTVSFVRFAGDIYNDVLLATLATAALALSVVVLRRGPSWRWVAMLSVLCALGMLTKATFVVVVALCIGAVGLAGLLHVAGPLRSRLGTGLLMTVPVVVTTVVASGWFYARNRSLSGSWFRSTPKEPVGSRPLRTLADNLTNPDFYLIVPERMFGNTDIEMGLGTSHQLSALLFGVALVLALSWLWRAARHRRGSWGIASLAAALLPVGVVVGMYATQLNHATGYGAYNFRYFLPATIAVGLLFGLAGVRAGGGSAVFVPMVMLLLVTATVRYSVHLSETRFSAEIGSATGLDAVIATAALNGFGEAAVVGCLAACLVGSGLVGISLWHARPSARGAGGVPQEARRLPVRPASPSRRPRHIRATRWRR